MFFLVENWPILTPPLSGKFHYFFLFLKPSLRVTQNQIATCLIWPSLYSLIHFSKRCVPSKYSPSTGLTLPSLYCLYCGAHVHALGWTSPQRMFILHLLRSEICPKFRMNRQSLQCSFLWNFFLPLQFAIKSVPSVCSFSNLVLSFKKKANCY